MFSSINKTFGCCRNIFGCSNKKIFAVPNFVAVTKPFFSVYKRDERWNTKCPNSDLKYYLKAFGDFSKPPKKLDSYSTLSLLHLIEMMSSPFRLVVC